MMGRSDAVGETKKEGGGVNSGTGIRCLFKHHVIKDQAAVSTHFLPTLCVCVLCLAHALAHYVVSADYRPEGQAVRNNKHTTHKHAPCSPV